MAYIMHNRVACSTIPSKQIFARYAFHGGKHPHGPRRGRRPTLRAALSAQAPPSCSAIAYRTRSPQTGPRALAAGIRCAGRGARSRLRVTGAPPAPPSETMGTRSPCPRREKKGGPGPAAEDPRSAITRSREPLTAHWRWACGSCGSFCKQRPAAASAAPIGELEPHRGPRVGTLSRGTV